MSTAGKGVTATVDAKRSKRLWQAASHGTRIAFWAAVLLFVATRCYLLFAFQPLHSDVHNVYFEYSGRVIDFADTPYRDFNIEYPPLAWWTIYLPRAIVGERIVNPHDVDEVTPVMNAYRRTFRWQMFLFDLASFALLGLIVRQRRPDWLGWALLGYAITTAVLGHVLYDRLDIAFLMLLVLWAFCWLRSLDEGRRPLLWSSLACLALGLGISYRLIPVIVVPVVLLGVWNLPHRGRRLLAAAAAIVLGAGLPMAIQYAASGPGVLSMFEYHRERGIQIESLYSTLMMGASVFGIPAFVAQTHGAFELSGPLAVGMKAVSAVCLYGFLLAMFGRAWWRRSAFQTVDAYREACFILSAAVILSNVLSPQYFIWAIPLLLLLGAEMLPDHPRARWTLSALLIAVAAMTTWLFPYHYYRTPSQPIGLVPKDANDPTVPAALAGVVLAARNLTYLGIVVWLGMLLFRAEARADQNSGLRPN